MTTASALRDDALFMSKQNTQTIYVISSLTLISELKKKDDVNMAVRNIALWQALENNPSYISEHMWHALRIQMGTRRAGLSKAGFNLT